MDTVPMRRLPTSSGLPSATVESEFVKHMPYLPSPSYPPASKSVCNDYAPMGPNLSEVRFS